MSWQSEGNGVGGGLGGSSQARIPPKQQLEKQILFIF